MKTNLPNKEENELIELLQLIDQLEIEKKQLQKQLEDTEIKLEEKQSQKQKLRKQLEQQKRPEYELAQIVIKDDINLASKKLTQYSLSDQIFTLINMLDFHPEEALTLIFKTYSDKEIIEKFKTHYLARIFHNLIEGSDILNMNWAKRVAKARSIFKRLEDEDKIEILVSKDLSIRAAAYLFDTIPRIKPPLSLTPQIRDLYLCHFMEKLLQNEDLIRIAELLSYYITEVYGKIFKEDFLTTALKTKADEKKYTIPWRIARAITYNPINAVKLFRNMSPDSVLGLLGIMHMNPYLPAPIRPYYREFSSNLPKIVEAASLPFQIYFFKYVHYKVASGIGKKAKPYILAKVMNHLTKERIALLLGRMFLPNVIWTLSDKQFDIKKVSNVLRMWYTDPKPRFRLSYVEVPHWFAFGKIMFSLCSETNIKKTVEIFALPEWNAEDIAQLLNNLTEQTTNEKEALETQALFLKTMMNDKNSQEKREKAKEIILKLDDKIRSQIIIVIKRLESTEKQGIENFKIDDLIKELRSKGLFKFLGEDDKFIKDLTEAISNKKGNQINKLSEKFAYKTAQEQKEKILLNLFGQYPEIGIKWFDRSKLMQKIWSKPETGKNSFSFDVLGLLFSTFLKHKSLKSYIDKAFWNVRNKEHLLVSQNMYQKIAISLLNEFLSKQRIRDIPRDRFILGMLKYDFDRSFALFLSILDENSDFDNYSKLVLNLREAHKLADKLMRHLGLLPSLKLLLIYWEIKENEDDGEKLPKRFKKFDFFPPTSDKIFNFVNDWSLETLKDFFYDLSNIFNEDGLYLIKELLDRWKNLDLQAERLLLLEAEEISQYFHKNLIEKENLENMAKLFIRLITHDKEEDYRNICEVVQYSEKSSQTMSYKEVASLLENYPQELVILLGYAIPEETRDALINVIIQLPETMIAQIFYLFYISFHDTVRVKIFTTKQVKSMVISENWNGLVIVKRLYEKEPEQINAALSAMKGLGEKAQLIANDLRKAII